MKKKGLLLLFILAIGLVMTGCGEKRKVGNSGVAIAMEGRIEELDVEKNGQADFDKKMQGMNQTETSLEQLREIKTYDALNSMMLDLDAGRIDYVRVPLCTGRYLAAQNPELSLVIGEAQFEYRMAMRKTDKELYDKLSDVLLDLKMDGTVGDLIDQYLNNEEGSVENVEQIKIDNAPTCRIGLTGDFPPFDYVTADGNPTGFNIALLNAISMRAEINFEIVQIEANARVTALASERIDCIYWMQNYFLDEFETESGDLLFTDSYLADRACFITKDYPVENIKKMYHCSE